MRISPKQKNRTIVEESGVDSMASFGNSEISHPGNYREMKNKPAHPLMCR